MQQSEKQTPITISPRFHEVLADFKLCYDDPIEIHENFMQLLIPIIGTADLDALAQQNLAHFVKASSKVLYSLVSPQENTVQS